MKKPKIQLVCIVGPTAIGKSDFAVSYALKNNGEIVSADSRQVYRGLDLGTGKITEKEMRGVPHHLLDVADPQETFNIAQFKKLAEKAIAEIHTRGKLPIICGGTGFYIDAVVNNTAYPKADFNPLLKKESTQKTTEEIFQILEKLDPTFAHKLNNSEKNNKQRLIRFVELAHTFGQVPKVSSSDSPYEVTWLGLKTTPEKLKQRIEKRLEKRLAEGLIEEVQKLHKNGLSFARMEELGLEYRYLARYLQGKLTLTEMKKTLLQEIRQYAKRQMTWWKRNKTITWQEVV